MKRILMKGKQRAKGSVLFTVVTVMLVMVLFLLSTLILTASANRRSYYSYYQKQAQYAAQAALDAITRYAYNDEDFNDWITNDLGTSEGQIDVSFSGDPGVINTNALSGTDHQIECTVKEIPTNYVYDDVSQKIFGQRAWKVTATAYVGAGNNRSSYSLSNYIYSTIPHNNMKVDVENQGTMRWTVKVPIPPDPGTHTEETVEDAQFTETGSSANAVYSLAPVSGGSNMSTFGPMASGTCNFPAGRTNYDGAPSKDETNDTGSTGDVLVINNYNSAVQRYFKLQTKYTGMVILGNMDLSNYMFIDADIPNPPTTAANAWNYRACNYVYIDGVLSSSSAKIAIGGSTPNATGTNLSTISTNWTSSKMPVNVYAGGVKVANANATLRIYGDLYLYDPEISSEYGGESSTALNAFTNRQITKTNTISSGIGGNLICNNNKLTLGDPQGNKNMTIEGDLILTNPDAELVIRSNITVNGNFYTAFGADKITYQNGKTLTVNGTTLNGAAANSKKDSAYPSDYKTNSPHDFSLFPFAYRLDEICQQYTRWDLAEATQAAAQAHVKDGGKNSDDDLIKESAYAGHTWTVKTMTGNVLDGDIIDNPADPRWDWSKAYYDQNLGKNVMRVSSSEVKTLYVPVTAPKTKSNAFIAKYEPSNPTTAENDLRQLNSSTYFETYTKFSGAFLTNAKDYTSQTPSPCNTAQFVYHDAAGEQQTVTIAGNVKTPMNNQGATKVYVINENCEIDLNQFNGGSVIYIDPTAKASERKNTDGEVQPLAIAIKGNTVQNYDITILVNNTGQYTATNTNYSCSDPDTFIPNARESEEKYNIPGRKEVYIFLEKGLKIMSKPFRLYCTGAYGQINTGNYDVISNPYYPTGETAEAWKALVKKDKYKYELVPNVCVFGEKDATLKFENAGIFNAEVLMPETVIDITDATLMAANTTNYRERPISTPYAGITGTARAVCSLGTLYVADTICKNAPTVFYLGDGYRDWKPEKVESHDTPPTEYEDQEKTSQAKKSDVNFADKNPNFQNDHLGAS